MANKDGIDILQASATIKTKVDEYILKCVIGPSHKQLLNEEVPQDLKVIQKRD